jgi:hypothetical protein
LRPGEISIARFAYARQSRGIRRSRINPMAKHFIQDAIKEPGALHRTLGVPEGQKIPAQKLTAAANSPNPKTRKRAVFARFLKGLKH